MNTITPQPILWSLENPYLYKVGVEIIPNFIRFKKTERSYIRTIEHSAKWRFPK
jgi:hypothetical protein